MFASNFADLAIITVYGELNQHIMFYFFSQVRAAIVRSKHCSNKKH